MRCPRAALTQQRSAESPGRPSGASGFLRALPTRAQTISQKAGEVKEGVTGAAQSAAEKTGMGGSKQ